MERRLSRHRLSIRNQIRAATAVIVLLLGSVGVWAVETEIFGAVIAHGSVAVTSNVKKVQHPTGGVIKEIFARDGDSVRLGDILIQIDDTMARASLGVVVRALDELITRQSRLEAERDGAD